MIKSALSIVYFEFFKNPDENLKPEWISRLLMILVTLFPSIPKILKHPFSWSLSALCFINTVKSLSWSSCQSYTHDKWLSVIVYPSIMTKSFCMSCFSLSNLIIDAVFVSISSWTGTTLIWNDLSSFNDLRLDIICSESSILTTMITLSSQLKWSHSRWIYIIGLFKI